MIIGTDCIDQKLAQKTFPAGLVKISEKIRLIRMIAAFRDLIKNANVLSSQWFSIRVLSLKIGWEALTYLVVTNTIVAFTNCTWTNLTCHYKAVIHSINLNQSINQSLVYLIHQADKNAVQFTSE